VALRTETQAAVNIDFRPCQGIGGLLEAFGVVVGKIVSKIAKPLPRFNAGDYVQLLQPAKDIKKGFGFGIRFE